MALLNSLFRTFLISDIGFELSWSHGEEYGIKGRIYAFAGSFAFYILKPVVLIEYGRFCYFITLQRKPVIVFEENQISGSPEMSDEGYYLSEEDRNNMIRFVKINRKILLKHFYFKISSAKLLYKSINKK